MASSLPLQVVLKSKYNGKYLEYVKEEGEVHGYLRFTGENVTSPLSKFEVQLAESDSQLVHLRSCYSNKYLAAASQANNYIVSEAEKPEEDQSKWSCTLFEPVPFSGDDYRFKHVKTGKYAVLMRKGEDPKSKCLYAGWATPNSELCDVCTVIDWNSLVVLPQHVAFKGDNGKYLIASNVHDSHVYLQFSSSDPGNALAAHEVFPEPDGHIQLKSTSYNYFWRFATNWIWVSSIYAGHFWPVKVDDDTIALRATGNNHFCMRITADGKSDCLNANTSSIRNEARLQVTELVLSREIYNVEYHLTRARVYNETVSVMGTGTGVNNSDSANSMDVKVSHSETTSTNWAWSISLKLGVKTKLTAKVPFIADGAIEISTELSTTHQWGGAESQTDTFETVYKVTVPAMTEVKVSAIGSKATCDVPFSYTQTDTLMDGTRRTYTKDDGLYTGINCYNIRYEQKNTPIDASKLGAPLV